MPGATHQYMIPGEVIRLNEDSRMKLGGFLREIIDDLETKYGVYLRNDIPVWWKWYHAIPAVTEKTWPFKGASNVVIPYIRTMADSVTATNFGKVFAAAPSVWGVKSQNETEKSTAYAYNMQRHLTWAGNGNDFDLKLPIYDWQNEKSVVGASVLALNWRVQKQALFFGAGTNNRSKIKTQMVEWKRGPVLEHVPREHYLWDTRFPIAEAPVVVREHEYTQYDLEIMATSDSAWDKEAIEFIKNNTGNEHTSAQPNRDANAKIESTGNAYHGNAAYRPHDVREIHIDLPLARGAGIDIPGHNDPGVPWIPLVVHFHYKSRRILRIVAEPYHIAHKPFYDGYYRKTAGRMHSPGLSKMLEHIQEMIATSFNQAVDSGTRQNSIWGKTTDMSLMNKPMDMAHPIKLTSMDDFEPINFGGQYLNNLPLMNAANVFGERVTGVNDPLLGRGASAGGHPAPATSTLALLDQSDKMSVASDELMRQRVSEIGRDIAVLYQQFETNEDGKFQAVHGIPDGDSLEEMLYPEEPIPVNYAFDVVAMSPNSNPDVEMKRAVTINQMTNDYWAFVLRVVQQVEQSGQMQGAVGPQLQQMAVKAIESKTEVFKKFLEASNVDDIKKFIAELRDANGPEQLNGAIEGARELAGGSGSVPSAGSLGGIGEGAESGAIVTPAGGGVLLG